MHRRVMLRKIVLFIKVRYYRLLMLVSLLYNSSSVFSILTSEDGVIVIQCCKLLSEIMALWLLLSEIMALWLIVNLFRFWLHKAGVYICQFAGSIILIKIHVSRDNDLAIFEILKLISLSFVRPLFKYFV